MTTFYARSDTTYQGSSIIAIPFSYIEKEHIKVYINNVETTNYTYLNDTQINITDTLKTNDVISVRRITPIDSKIVTYANLGMLTHENLNLSGDQLLDSIQEMRDDNTQFKTDVNSTLTTSKTDIDTQLTNFKTEINSELTAVNEAASKINSIQESVTTCTEKATLATNEATIATTKANEATLAASALSGKASQVDTNTTNISNLQSNVVLKDGSVDFTRLQSYKTYTVSNATNATPIVVTAVGHSFLTGDKVQISGVGGNTAANGTFTITKIGVDTFSLDGSVGNGAFSSNGTAMIVPVADDNIASVAFVKNNSASYIGSIVSIMCTSDYVPDGCLACDGAEYTFSQFPTFVTNYLTSTPAKLLTCTYTDYATDITTYGQCAKFAVDTVNQTFKVPTIKDGSFIQQAKSDSELGKSYNAGLPNITGYCAGNIGYQTKATGGCFYQNASSDGVLGPTNVDGDSVYQRFDASHSNSTYGNSTTVQPNAVALRFFVVVANGTVNQSQMDWSAWASSLAGKANNDLSNCTKPYITETYVNGTSWYRVYSDGWIEQGGQSNATLSQDSNITITLLKIFKNTNYYVNSIIYGENKSINSQGENQIYSKTISTFVYFHGADTTTNHLIWEAKGY
jgi:hypothetical protein